MLGCDSSEVIPLRSPSCHRYDVVESATTALNRYRRRQRLRRRRNTTYYQSLLRLLRRLRVSGFYSKATVASWLVGGRSRADQVG